MDSLLYVYLTNGKRLLINVDKILSIVASGNDNEWRCVMDTKELIVINISDYQFDKIIDYLSYKNVIHKDLP